VANNSARPVSQDEGGERDQGGIRRPRLADQRTRHQHQPACHDQDLPAGGPDMLYDFFVSLGGYYETVEIVIG
jgi:hypothetical protein